MKRHFDEYKDDFLTPTEDNFSSFLDKASFLQDQIMRKVSLKTPRVPLKQHFRYDQDMPPIPRYGRSSSEVLKELSIAFEGSIRWNQPTALFNITPTPLLDSVAAASIATLHNFNTLWDYTSGKVTKFEKDIVAFLAHLADWNIQSSDGLSTSGGKATLMYAIKCGLNTSKRQSVHEGLRGNYVVFASKASHYSIEDVCNYVGIGRDNVIRIAIDKSGTMLPEALEEAMRHSLQNGKRIAAIIALGGDTIEHAVDPIRKIDSIRRKLTKEFSLNYTPFLHLDSVNAWIGLTFRAYDFNANPLKISKKPLQKIHSLIKRLQEVQYADSFSADFHKTGLAPYTSSFFVAREAVQLHSINRGTLLNKKPIYQYGEVHTHHVSFENSRSAQGILSAWTSIQRLGIEGYQQYWAQLLTISDYLKREIDIKYDKEMRVLNTTALGHPLVLQLLPPGFGHSFNKLTSNSEELETYSSYCFELHEYIAHHLLKSNAPYPLLGFIPRYRYEYDGLKRPAFLLYSNHPHVDEKECDSILRMIVKVKHDFERQRKNSRDSSAKRLQHLPK